MMARELQRIVAQCILSGSTPITHITLDCSRSGLRYVANQAGMLMDYDALMGVMVYIPGAHSPVWARRTMTDERVSVCERPRDGHQYIRKMESDAWNLKHGKKTA